MNGAELRRRLRRLRAFVSDVDGVLTDGALYYGPRGPALKRFDVKDGMGLRLLREAGLALALISGETGPIVEARAAKLKIRDVFQGVEDKASVLRRFLASKGIDPSECAYAGDDVNDLGPMRLAGVAFAPADAVPAARRAAHWTSSLPGGRGAAREFCDLILAARGDSA
jgi:3-deoxy-D-manno-octulosonate 8-phosphate phosphatase (KDO 8-P phosphatase)